MYLVKNPSSLQRNSRTKKTSIQGSQMLSPPNSFRETKSNQSTPKPVPARKMSDPDIHYTSGAMTNLVNRIKFIV